MSFDICQTMLYLKNMDQNGKTLQYCTELDIVNMLTIAPSIQLDLLTVFFGCVFYHVILVCCGQRGNMSKPWKRKTGSQQIQNDTGFESAFTMVNVTLTIDTIILICKQKLVVQIK